jgi:hypothetical protein
MGIVRYPIAPSTVLKRAFNLECEPDDRMFLYTSDITGTSFGKKMSKGALVSFGVQGNGVVHLLNDNDPGAWGASQFVVKDVIVKTCGNLFHEEVEMIERARPGFKDAYTDMKLQLDDHQIITLVRFNLGNAIHFANRFLPEHVGKLVH